MDGTRRARLIALVATLTLGLTLTTAALLTTHVGPGRGTLDPPSMTIRTASPMTDAATAVIPRTTPPPSYPGPGAPAVRPLVPPPATTVEHS